MVPWRTASLGPGTAREKELTMHVSSSIALGALIVGLAASQQTTSPPEPVSSEVVAEVAVPASLAFGDFDGDGLQDVLALGTEGTLRLLRNRGDGGFEDVSAFAGMDAVRGASLVLWEDYDGDGRLDLFVGTACGPRYLFRNEGGGLFTDVAREGDLGRESCGDRYARWMDYDRDGRLDLYVEGTAGGRLYHALGEDGFEERVITVGPAARANEGVVGARVSELQTEVDSREAKASESGAGHSWVGDPTTGSVGSEDPGRSAFSSGAGAPAGTGASASLRTLPTCIPSIQDQGHPTRCLRASSVPTPGMLFPPPHDGGVDNVVSGADAFIGGGKLNTASGAQAVIGGGTSNTASGLNATVGGGEWNRALSTAVPLHPYGAATVGGGYLNTASKPGATVSGGGTNVASGKFSTVGGGGGAYYGFYWRSNIASGTGSTIAGGSNNGASEGYSTIGGGVSNEARGYSTTVAGGEYNRATSSGSTISGGSCNVSSGSRATVGGGVGNRAVGAGSTVPGGQLNEALGDYSFAAGRRAKANHAGAFVWGDGQNLDKTSSAADEFNVYASGGVRLFTNSAATTGAALAPGSGTWSQLSDRDSKENLATVDARAVLEAVVALPISTWNYRTQDDSIRHMGPMAQDFRAAFGLGVSEKLIDTVDPDGVALAAIQGLYRLVEEQRVEIEALRTELEGRAPVEH